MTRQEMRTRILRAVNESPTTPVYWSLAEVDGYIAEALEVVAEETPGWKRTFTIPRRPGTLVYQLPGLGTDILAPYRIWLPDLARRLEAKTLADLDARHERWQEVTGEPWWWVPVSWDQWLLWPFPTSGEGVMQVDCYCWPPELLDDADRPELHPSSHEALVVYGQFLGRLKQWDAAGAVAQLRRFLGAAGSARSQANVRQIQEHTLVRGVARADD